MMLRPHKKVIDHQEIQEIQQKNLESGLAFAALTTPSGTNEKDLYESIVEIPHYDSQWLQLLDKENETALVQENFEEFQNLYHPIIKDKNFKNLMEIDDLGRVQISHDQATRKQLMRYINDNVYQNIDKKVMGVKKYHNVDNGSTSKIKKDPL